MEQSPKIEPSPFVLGSSCDLAFFSATYLDDDGIIPELYLTERNEKKERKNDSFDIRSYEYEDRPEEERDLMFCLTEQTINQLYDKEILQ